ncbi:MAG: hypothetical protein MH204_01840 [Fimbriimonadaceae bacterium]|nr:hypothetical protein [Fimbriimonadaceae bacterium]
MSLALRLKAVVNRFDLDAEIDAVTAAWPEVDSDARARARLHLHQSLDDLNMHIQMVGTPEATAELYEALAIWYLQARCEWSQVNLAANRRFWTSGSADQALMIRTSVGSRLLSNIGSLLDEADVDVLESGLLSTLNRLLFPV